MRKTNWDTQEYFILLFFIWILAGLILGIFRMGIVKFSDLLFASLSFPAFMVMFLIISVNLWVLSIISLFFLIIIPLYGLYDLIHVSSMCLSFILYLIISFAGYFYECFPANPFPAYKRVRTGFILSCKDFFDKLYFRQQVSPGTFYDGILYGHLPVYQNALNDIMLEVLNEDYLCHNRLEEMSYEQKNKILRIAKNLNKRGLESGYLLAMLHQYFLRPDDIFDVFRKPRSQAIFSQWSELAVNKYPYEGYKAWQSVLQTYGDKNIQ